MSNKILYIFISIIISQYSHTYGCDKNIVIYQGTEYRISDNNLTFCLLDHLTAQNTDESKISENLETFFYICKISDGALSEALSPYCMKVALRYTHEFIEKLETMIASQNHSVWWENIIYNIANDQSVYVKEIDGKFWAEVDYIEDYERILKFRKINIRDVIDLD